MRIQLPIAALAACTLVLTARTLAQGEDPAQRPALGSVDDELPSVAALHAWAKRSAAKKGGAPAPADLPQPYLDLDYDGYRALRAKRSTRLWDGTAARFRAEPLHLGGHYQIPVRVSVIGRDGKMRPYGFRSEAFDLPEGLKPLPEGSGFAGLRFLSCERRLGAFDEFLVFHGASYFRAVGRCHGFGTSARGLAIDTAQPSGEEFPSFTRFLLEEPEPGTQALVLHGLMESKSATGVFRFEVTPGLETVMDVDAVLYPRRALEQVGIAPLTSMFLFAPRRGRRVDDFRGAVHDADGLAIITGSGERLWRPLSNPKSLQVSAFVDQSPRGFGLIQRSRDAGSFGDLEAEYERRPSVWVEPLEPWGKGAVVLVEIPTETEFNDNVVAFWRPEVPLAAGVPARFRYRLRFADGAPDEADVSRVVCTGEGRAVGALAESTARVFAVDFLGAESLRGVPLGELELDAWASAGTLEETRLERLHGGGVRAVLRFEPGPDVRAADLSAALRTKGKGEGEGMDWMGVVSERWMTRWQR